ncbi:MAG: hypothetical protein JWL71_3834 [Acidobacteria bacterium]|nr:hypothetical protein [Acidobacteriota bacterium]
MRPTVLLAAALAAFAASSVNAQRPRDDAFVASRNHPAIRYAAAPTRDPVAVLNQRIRDGSAHLAFDAQTGYLTAALDALGIPRQSQALVFSETSAQAHRISVRNPRAIYFGDDVAIGWVRGAEALEVAAHDPVQGTIFYTLEQQAAAVPTFTRNDTCLQCHLTWDTLGVPGPIVLSTFPMTDDPAAYAGGLTVSHDTPLAERWSGWYVTGASTDRHMGNVPVIVKPAELTANAARAGRPLASIANEFDATGFLTPYSDIVALMVLDHQTRAANLITRVGWEARVATSEGADPLTARVTAAVRDLARYFLFVDEAPLSGEVRGTSGFADAFSARGPRDHTGRSLRQLDLDRRLLRYRCSYMIYTPAFDALPAAVRQAIYAEMWRLLAGPGRPAAERQAIVEILRDTKTDLPATFTGGAR